MKKKIKSLFLTSSVLLVPAIFAVSCASTGGNGRGDSAWNPDYDQSTTLGGTYDYEKFLSQSTTNWDPSSREATIDLRALEKLSTSFPFVMPGINFTSLDNMFSKMVDPNSGLQDQINIYSKLVENSAFRTSLKTSYYSYSLMSKSYDGTTSADLATAGFYHARPTAANGNIGTLAAPAWNNLSGQYGVTPTSTDLIDVVKAIFKDGTTFPAGSKMQVNNAISNANIANTATYYTNYFDVSSQTYKPLTNPGWFFYQPIDSTGRGIQPKSSVNSPDKFVAASSNRLDDSDFTYDAVNEVIKIKTLDIVQLGSTPAGSDAVAIANDFGVLSKEVPILNGDRASLMMPPMMIYVPVNYQFVYDSAQNTYLKDGQPIDIFSPQALEFIEPVLPWDELFDAKDWTPTQMVVGKDSYALTSYDVHSQILGSYGLSTNLLYEKSNNGKFPNALSYDETHLGVPEYMLKLNPSDKLHLRKMTGGGSDNYGSVSPVLSGASALAEATPDSNVLSSIPKVQGSSTTSSDNLFKLIIDENGNNIADADEIYGFWATGSDNKSLGVYSGFFKEQPLSKENAKNLTQNDGDPNSGYVYDINQWGKPISSDGTGASVYNSIPDDKLEKTHLSGDFQAINPINVDGVSITPLPKTNQDGTAVESYQGAGFQILPISSVISNSSFLSPQDMGFAAYIKEEAHDGQAEHFFSRKYYFDTDGATDISTISGDAKEKYRLPQILSGFYRDDATLDYNEYKTAIDGGTSTTKAYLEQHTKYTPTNPNARFIVPNEGSDSITFGGKRLPVNTINEHMSLHYEHGIDKVLLARTGATIGGGATSITTRPVPIISGKTWNVDNKDINNTMKFNQQVNFGGSVANAPLEFVSLIDGRNVDLFQSSVLSSPITINFNWGTTKVGYITNFDASDFGQLFGDFKVLSDDIFGMKDISFIPLSLYNSVTRFSNRYAPTDLDRLFLDSPTNTNYHLSTPNGMPIAWFIANDIDKMIGNDESSMPVWQQGGHP